MQNRKQLMSKTNAKSSHKVPSVKVRWMGKVYGIERICGTAYYLWSWTWFHFQTTNEYLWWTRVCMLARSLASRKSRYYKSWQIRRVLSMCHRVIK